MRVLRVALIKSSPHDLYILTKIMVVEEIMEVVEEIVVEVAEEIVEEVEVVNKVRRF